MAVESGVLEEVVGRLGAWNRSYTVHEVIQEFLPEVYEPVDSQGSDERYTYLLGFPNALQSVLLVRRAVVGIVEQQTTTRTQV